MNSLSVSEAGGQFLRSFPESLGPIWRTLVSHGVRNTLIPMLGKTGRFPECRMMTENSEVWLITNRTGTNLHRYAIDELIKDPEFDHLRRFFERGSHPQTEVVLSPKEKSSEAWCRRFRSWT